MKKINLLVIHAFANDRTGGNPAGLVLKADDLSTAEKLEIARRAGFSETAFVSRSTIADLKLEFFTPNRQIPHCGHATIATFSFLKAEGKIIANSATKETIDGIRRIYFEGELAFMEQRAPQFQPLHAKDLQWALSALGLTAEDLLPGLLPEIVNTGNAFLVFPLSKPEILQAIQPNENIIRKLSKNYGLIGFYPFAPTQGRPIDATTRMFAPYYGIAEEAATGMAAGPLAAYLHQYGMMSGKELFIEQGRYMQPPSPSCILVKLEKENGRIQRLYAGGKAYLVGEREICFSRSDQPENDL